MRVVLKTLRKLLFGETWFIPIGVAVILVVGGLVVRPIDEFTWADAGGPVLLVAVLLLVTEAIGRGARPKR